MEASQASEAGSIPVARSTTARLRAGRFCHASATGTPGLPHTLRQAQPVQNSPHSRPWQAIPVQNSPGSRQNAHCGPFSACRENFIPLSPPTGRAGRTLYRSHHQQVEQGELCTAFTTHTTSRENFVPHAGPMPVQNSPRSQPSRVEPVQNSPRTPKMAHFSTYYASRENFVTLSPPTRRAGRKKSRTNTPPHPPTRPSPNFACNSIA